MGKRLTELSFEDWVDHVVLAAKQFYQVIVDGDLWDYQLVPDLTLEYLIRLFSDPLAAFEPYYFDEEIGQALWYVASSGGSDFMFLLSDSNVSLPLRKACAGAIFDLYAKLFAVKCTPHLSHLIRTAQPDVSPINMPCYMWWDILPYLGKPDDPDHRQIDPVMLDVMRRTLDLESVACREGALHGLGHWHAIYPNDVEEIVDTFLASHLQIAPELRDYALSARGGCVQ
jgi:hypothetical protein